MKRRHTGARQWAVELAAANGRLKREIAQRKTAEQSLKTSKRHYTELLAQSRQMQAQLRHLSYQVLLAQEEERKQISRELHDEIAQTLAGINVYLAALKVEAGDKTNGLGRNIARTQTLVERSMNIVHRFARELRPTVLDDLGLIPAIHSFMKGFTKRTHIPIRFTASAAVEQLNSTKRTVLYRVAQEALTNIAKHATAGRVKVSLKKISGAVRLEVHDDGKSFQVERVLIAKRNQRLGLVGMRERIEMVGGSFQIQSARGQGTTVCAQIPLDSRARS
jgi:signal transduction histidine kinase